MPASRFRALLGAATLVLVSALTACTGSSNPTTTPTASASASPSSTIPVSSNLDAIAVTGTYGKDASVTIATPWSVDQTRTKVLVQGSGATVSADGIVKVHYTGYNGRTGANFDESYSGGNPIEFPLTGVVKGFQAGLTGQQVGSRVLIGIPSKDGYASGNTSAGIEVGDSLVFVVDIMDASLAGPSGTPVTPPSGLPIVTDTNGKPSITIPAGLAAPTSLGVQVLIQGSGPAVAANSTIVTHYLGISWNTGKVIDDKYAALDTGAVSSAIPGFQKGLLGQKVGSRVLLVLPPSESWPAGNYKLGIAQGDSVVYVVDILYILTS